MKTKFLNYFEIRFVLLITILLQSCSSIPELEYQCNNLNKESKTRYSLFKNISSKELKRRSKIDVPTYSSLNKFSVFSEIVNEVRSAKTGSKIISIDLQGYKSVNLGNIIIANIKNEIALKLFLNTSKYSQGFFALINFGKDHISIFPPTHKDLIKKSFKRQKIKRSDLQDIELVFNVSSSREILANMKFNEGQKVSILANNIEKPFRMDLREASNGQFNLNQKWIMYFYDISNSSIMGGKKTTGYYVYVNNKDVKDMKIHRFTKSKVACYKDSQGFKFTSTIDKKLK